MKKLIRRIKCWWHFRHQWKELKKACKEAEATREFLKSPAAEKLIGYLPGHPLCKSNINAPDERLPKVCPACGHTVTPSKIDDRIVACVPCKMVFATAGAMNDPNIQRDFTHAHAGLKLAKKSNKAEIPDHKIGGDIHNDIINYIRDKEIARARTFGREHRRKMDEND